MSHEYNPKNEDEPTKEEWAVYETNSLLCLLDDGGISINRAATLCCLTPERVYEIVKSNKDKISCIGLSKDFRTYCIAPAKDRPIHMVIPDFVVE